MRFMKTAAAVPVVAALLVLAGPLPVDAAAHRALAIATWMVLSWILEPIHPAIVGFAGCFFFVAAQCAEFDVAFGGFGTETPWALYGALMLVAAVRASGGVDRIAAAIPASVATATFAVAASVVTLAGALTGMIVDSAIARGVILVVLALALSERMRVARAINATGPLVAVASYAAAALGADSSGAAPSLIWRLVTLAVVIGIASRFVSATDETPADIDAERRDNPIPVLALLGVTLVVWLTTRVHGVSPGIVALAAGIAVAFPGIRPGAKGPVADPIALILAGAALSVPLVLEHTQAAGIFDHGANGAVTEYWRDVITAVFDPRMHAVNGGPVVKLAVYQSPALILGATAAGFTTRDVWKFGAALAVAGGLVMFVA